MKIRKRVSLVLFLALLPWGCSSDESSGSNAPATGGTGASGGSAGSGGAATGGSSGSSATGGSAGNTAGVGGTTEDAGSDVTTFVFPACAVACATIAEVCTQTAMEEATCVSGCTDGTFDADCGQLLKDYLACVNLTPQNVICADGMGQNPDCGAEGSAFAACDSPGN